MGYMVQTMESFSANIFKQDIFSLMLLVSKWQKEAENLWKYLDFKLSNTSKHTKA